MPSPVCSICTRRDAGTINGLLREGRSVLSVAHEFSLSEDALQNHKKKGHLTRHPAIPTIPRAKSAKAAVDPLDELVTALRDQALSNNGNPAIVHQYRLALAAQTDAKNGAAPSRDLALEPEWIALRSKMLKALEAHPKARVAVAEALA